MKICSICLKCYDDSNATCAVEGHGPLTQARNGNCRIVEGYRIDSRFESTSPVELYRATHLASKKSVFIRFIEREDSFSELEDELHALSEITHPNLVTVFEYGEVDENEFFVVQEAPPGQSLQVHLEELSPLPEKQSIEIVRQVADGLIELHAKEVTHGAVNPANIFFTKSAAGDYQVKLCNLDFGGMVQKVVSASAEGEDAKIDLLRYFSPEHFENRLIDVSSDIYSLAAVFYHLLLGRPTVDTPNAESVSNFVFDQSDVWGLHIELRALLAHLLKQSFQRRLELRLATTRNFVSQLRQIELIADRLSANKGGSTTQRSNFEQPVDTAPTNRQATPAKRIFEEAIVPEVEVFGKPEIDSSPVTKTAIVSESEVEKPVKSTSYETPAIKTDYSVEQVQVFDAEFDDDSEFASGAGEKPEWEKREYPEEPVKPAAGARQRQSDLRLSGSRSVLFAACLLVAAVFGGVITATVLEWQSDTTSAKAVNPEDAVNDEKSDADPVRTAEIEAADFLDSEEPEDPETTGPGRRELDQVVNLDSSTQSPVEFAATGPAKPQQEAGSKSKRPTKRKRGKSNKSRKQDESKEKKSEIFKTIVIYY